MLTIRAMSDGAGYSANHLTQNDYYSENERVVGQWFGKGAERLELVGEVTDEAFELIREARDPATGDMLRQRRSADRTDENGVVQARGRTLYDFTFSAPKSVSVMAILGGDERLIEAHKRAVTEALTELERISQTRVRQLGKNEDRDTGNIVVARYEHDSSRRLDPQLHSHCVAGNLTFDEIEERWKALQATEIYKSRSYLTEVYRNSLARQVTELGYSIVDRAPKRGRDMGFEIAEVPQPIIDEFSQGSKVREESVKKFTKERGRVPTDNETTVLVKEERPEKLAEISTEEVRKLQRERLTPQGQKQLEAVRTKAQERENSHKPFQDFWTQSSRAIQFAIEHTFSRVSVSKDTALLTEALQHGRGKVALEQIKTALDVQEAAGNVFRAGRELATQRGLDRERAIIATINEGIGEFEPLGKLHPLTQRLNDAQADALKAVLDSQDFAFNIQGAAGAGKTQLLGELRHQLARNDRPFIAVAPTTSAVEELQKVGYEDAVTVTALLDNPEHRAFTKGATLLIDEAGMIGAEPMTQLLHLARTSGARVVFSGDTSQLQPVEAGDSLMVLEKHSRLQGKSLTEVQRQQEERYREAVEKFREDPNWGFNRLLAMNAIREVDYLDRPRAVAEAYMKSDKETFLICPTHEEIGRVTHEVRRLAKEAGRLTNSETVEHFVPCSWTQAQKRDVSKFHAGQILVFHKATKDVRRNEAVEVTRAEDNAVFGRGEDGREVRITARQAKAFTVHDPAGIEVAEGDTLLLQANRRGDLKFTNGERVKVESIDRHGNKTLEDGRILPASYKQFTHGYAVTAHASQGKTVDRVIVSGDEMAKELFYVAISRGRYECEVFTSDSERLHAALTESAARTSATELHMRLHAWQYAERAQAHNNELNRTADLQAGRTATATAPAQAPAAAPAAAQEASVDH